MLTKEKQLMTTLRNALSAVAAIVAVVLPFAVAAQTPILIKFSHVVAPDTPKGKGANKFKELAEKYTDGKVKVEVYPNSQLYKDKEEVEALQLGAVQMLAPSLSKFGPLGAKEFEAFDLPFIFPDYAALRRVTDGPIGKKMLRKLEDKGIVGLSFWDNGFKVMSANKPIKSPDDMLGLKIRIQSSKVLEAEVKALGALPQVMAFGEVYQALQTGVVDGTENPPSNMYTQKMHEVQKHAALTNHGYLGYAVIVNKTFWDGLPAEVRSALEKAMAETTEYTNQIAEKENADALELMKKSGRTAFYAPTDKERQAWFDTLKPVHKEMAARIGKELLEEISKTTGVNN
jgi:C4-dicarboxylate-binding protein DctP